MMNSQAVLASEDDGPTEELRSVPAPSDRLLGRNGGELEKREEDGEEEREREKREEDGEEEREREKREEDGEEERERETAEGEEKISFSGLIRVSSELSLTIRDPQIVDFVRRQIEKLPEVVSGRFPVTPERLNACLAHHLRSPFTLNSRCEWWTSYVDWDSVGRLTNASNSARASRYRTAVELAVLAVSNFRRMSSNSLGRLGELTRVVSLLSNPLYGTHRSLPRDHQPRVGYSRLGDQLGIGHRRVEIRPLTVVGGSREPGVIGAFFRMAITRERLVNLEEFSGAAGQTIDDREATRDDERREAEERWFTRWARCCCFCCSKRTNPDPPDRDTDISVTN